MKIALIGYGQMGQAIDAVASSMDATVVSRVSPTRGDYSSISEASVGLADVCIDFSHPDCIVDHIHQLAALKKPIVVGTTGWDPATPSIHTLVNEQQVGLVYAENFSLGVHAFQQVVEEAARRFSRLPGYDVAGLEIHHNRKADSPSGTGKWLGATLAQQFSRDVDFSSVRCGEVPGTHTVLFSSIGDTVTLTHQAHNREAWARGAVTAAHWIKNRPGMYHVSDMFQSEVPCTVS